MSHVYEIFSFTFDPSFVKETRRNNMLGNEMADQHRTKAVGHICSKFKGLLILITSPAPHCMMRESKPIKILRLK
jgi:hypothetical protein